MVEKWLQHALRRTKCPLLVSCQGLVFFGQSCELQFLLGEVQVARRDVHAIRHDGIDILLDGLHGASHDVWLSCTDRSTEAMGNVC